MNNNKYINKYIKKEPEIKQKYIYELENTFMKRYAEAKNNQFSCPEFENLFECLFNFLEKSLLSINENEHSLIWNIMQGLELIKNCSQITVCTNTKINNCPKPDINLNDQKYYTDPVVPLPCSNNIYETPFNGVIFPYAYCIRVLVRIMHIIDSINLYILSKDMSLEEKNNFYKSPYAYIYFRNRYEYYLDYLLDNAPNVFILPIIQSVGATTLLNIRGSRIQICGIVFDKIFVDEDYQSPGNFFWHDINHARRIYQNNIWYCKQKNIDLEDLYIRMKKDVSYLLPISKWLTEENKNLLSIIKILLFEVVHEDALPFLLDEIVRDILYEVGECYPYERTKGVPGKNFQRDNIRFYEQGATTMATLYNKIRHAFFEKETPDDMIVKIDIRNSDNLAKGTIILLKKIYELWNKPFPENISYEKIILLIASQDYSHHKNVELKGIPEDKIFNNMQKRLFNKNNRPRNNTSSIPNIPSNNFSGGSKKKKSKTKEIFSKNKLVSKTSGTKKIKKLFF